MNVRITYPPAEKRHTAKQKLISCCKWTFLFAGLLCAAVNVSTCGKSWSLIVIWSMWLVWTQLVSPDMVEYNRISQTIKLIVNACILLFLVDVIAAPGWAIEVVSIVGFSALILVAVLFFTDFETQRQNMFPMLLFCAACLTGAVVGLIGQHWTGSWTFTVMGTVALSLLVGCAVKLGKEFLTDFRKYFCAR